MSIENDLNKALDATANLAKLANQVEYAAKVYKLVNELIANQKYDEASGAMQALALITLA